MATRRGCRPDARRGWSAVTRSRLRGQLVCRPGTPGRKTRRCYFRRLSGHLLARGSNLGVARAHASVKCGVQRALRAAFPRESSRSTTEGPCIHLCDRGRNAAGRARADDDARIPPYPSARRRLRATIVRMVLARRNVVPGFGDVRAASGANIKVYPCCPCRGGGMHFGMRSPS
ncbi:hypothetical protein HPB50_015397 [Hyalomma asiaticum]|uniref:Uncharacterized protein n=1 Tax=Hyalomma asiaticum TaxID=266040 RepID=A0ACB7TJ31_HYAAI|nr:hypothetical protein HPB50_015397 [Hyalomma asiaticum]